MALHRLWFLIQGLYYGLTGIWPVLHIDSFMLITGYKTDQWLVKTFGSVLFVCGIFYCRKSRREDLSSDGFFIATFLTIALSVADLYYSLSGVISKIYLVDAGAQLLLLSGWFVVWRKKSKQDQTR